MLELTQKYRNQRGEKNSSKLGQRSRLPLEQTWQIHEASKQTEREVLD